MEQVKKSLVILTLLLVATGTSALALTFSDVGGAYDSYKGSGIIANTDELNWIAGIYGYAPGDLTFTKWDHDDAGVPQWNQATSPPAGESPIYLDFRSEGATDDPFAFLIKAATGTALSFDDGVTQVSGVSTILFDNLALTQYAVIDENWFTKATGNFSYETISHTSFTYGDDGGGGGGGDPIPEPSTFILLGAGLAGLAFYRRKKN